MKLLEDRGELIGSNADSGVFHGEIRERIVSSGRDCHLAASIRKLQCVAREVVQNLTESLSIGKDDEVDGNVHGDIHGLGAVNLGDPGGDFLDDGSSLELLTIE